MQGVENARLENGAPKMQDRKCEKNKLGATCVVTVVTKMKYASKATTACMQKTRKTVPLKHTISCFQ